VSKFNQLFSLLNKEFAVQQELQKVLEKEHQAQKQAAYRCKIK